VLCCVQAICSWVAPLKSAAGAIVITGDLNAPPDEQLHDVASRNGFASSHKVGEGHRGDRGGYMQLLSWGSPSA
jgi:hypothetical protein